MLKNLGMFVVVFFMNFYMQPSDGEATGLLELQPCNFYREQRRSQRIIDKLEERLKVYSNCDRCRAVNRNQPNYKDVGDCFQRAFFFNQGYEDGIKGITKDLEVAGYKESCCSRAGSCLLPCLCPCWNQCFYDHKIGETQRHLAILKDAHKKGSYIER